MRRATTTTIRSHYGRSQIIDKIKHGLSSLNIDTPTTNDLAAVDEFHVGGLAATSALLEQIDISPADLVLDVGCGIGGAARYVSTKYGANVIGVDLTQEYIEAGMVLNAMCGLSAGQVALKVGSGTELGETLGIDSNKFDKAFLLHVGMNIADKERLFLEIAAQLKTGGKLAIYDIVRVGNNAAEQLDYPVPWASNAEMDYASSDHVYRAAATTAGLELIAEHNCYDRSMAFFESFQKKAAAERASTTSTQEPPPLGLHILMGNDFPVKMRNMSLNIKKKRMTPFEFIFEKT